jgi:phage tail sheath gpL-like
MTTISVTGVGSNFYVPATLIEIIFNQGESGGAQGPREVVFYSPKSSSGTGTVNQKYECQNVAQAETAAGTGSPGHRAALRHFAVPGARRFWLVPYAATSAGSATSATNALVVAGTTGTTGTQHIYVCGEDCSYVSSATDEFIAVGAGLTAAINNKSWLPVTATSTGTATGSTISITSRIAGLSANKAIKVRTKIDNGPITITGAADLAGGLEGTTTEAANLATAMAAIASTSGLYYHCWGGGTSTGTAYAALTSMKTALAARSAANPGLRAVGITACRDTLANATTVANAQNYERLQVLWQENGEDDPASLVGNWAAVRCAQENTDSAKNFAGYGTRGEADWLVTPAFSDSDWPTVTEQNTAITEGLAPIASTPSGTYMVLSVNTRAKTSSLYDFRSTETHRCSVADDLAAALSSRWTLNYGGQKLRDDVKLANGQVDPNQKRTKGVVTPSQVRAGLINKTLNEFDDAGKIQDTANTIANAVVQKSLVNNARIEFELNVRAIDMANQFLGRINEVSPA